jgi:TolB-like protein
MIYEIGDFRLDTGQGVLLRDGVRVPLVPKAIELLAALVAAGGRVVGKDELLSTVWPDVTVEEGNLAKLVFLLRRELGEAAIETIPRRGYRFAGQARAPTEPRGATPTLAVLPFSDLSPAGDQQHLCEGISEEIMAALGAIPGLAVVARASVFRLARQGLDARELGRRLGAVALVDGSVRKSGERLRVAVQLVDAAAGVQRWSETFDRQLGDAFALQHDIAAAVARNLLAVVPADAAPRRAPDFAAWELYLQGRYLWNRRPGDVVWKALECFEKAAALDPGFAAAWAGMADVYSTLGSWESGVLPHAEAQEKARAFAERALAIDPTLAEAHTTLAYTSLHYGWDLAGADAGFRHALSVSPRYASAHHWQSHALAAAGRFDESLRASERALACDPQNLLLHVHLAWHWHMARDAARTLEAGERVVAMDPRFHWGHYFVGWGAEMRGEVDRAVDAFTLAARCADDNPVMLGGLGRARALAGDDAAAGRALIDLESRGGAHHLYAYEIALIHLARGRREETLDWLEHALAARSGWMIYAPVDPRLDPLRSSPRFAKLLAAVVERRLG